MTEDKNETGVSCEASAGSEGNGKSEENGEAKSAPVVKSSIELELEAAATSQKKFNIDDRVRSLSGDRCLGVVKEVREELVSPTDEVRDRVKMIKVLWDNGTFSYFGPEALELVEGS